MGINLQQTNAQSHCDSMAACSGLAAGPTIADREIQRNGLAATSPTSLQCSATTLQRIIHLQSATDFPNSPSWESGNYVVRINLTTGNGRTTWEDSYICRVNSACSSQATVGSLTGQAISLSTTGVKTMTISGAAQTANQTDTLYLVLGFKNNVGGTFSFAVQFDQQIDTPLTQWQSAAAQVDGLGTVIVEARVDRKCEALVGAVCGIDSISSVVRAAQAQVDGLLSVAAAGTVDRKLLAQVDGQAGVITAGTVERKLAAQVDAILNVISASSVARPIIAEINAALNVISQIGIVCLIQGAINALGRVQVIASVSRHLQASIDAVFQFISFLAGLQPSFIFLSQNYSSTYKSLDYSGPFLASDKSKTFASVDYTNTFLAKDYSDTFNAT